MYRYGQLYGYTNCDFTIFTNVTTLICVVISYLIRTLNPERPEPFGLNPYTLGA